MHSPKTVWGFLLQFSFIHKAPNQNNSYGALFCNVRKKSSTIYSEHSPGDYEKEEFPFNRKSPPNKGKRLKEGQPSAMTGWEVRGKREKKGDCRETRTKHKL